MDYIDEINCIDEATRLIFSDEKRFFLYISELTPRLLKMYASYCDMLMEKESTSAFLGPDDLLVRFVRLNSALERKDKVAIYDSLQYEIRDFVMYCNMLENK